MIESDEQKAAREEREKKEKIDKTLKTTARSIHDKSARKTFTEILSTQLVESFEIYRLNKFTLFLSALIAGMEIGFSYLLITSFFGKFDDLIPAEYLYQFLAFLYPIGFILVVLGQSTLFTEQTALLTLPVLNGKKSIVSLLELWGVVIIGNIVGGMIFSLLAIFIAPHLHLFDYENIENLSHHVLSVPFHVLFFSAVLAGWLMALLSWLLSSANDTISIIFLVFLLTGTIGFLGLHHSIVGNIEVFSGLLTGAVSFQDYILFLINALLGNAVGGAIFVALFKYKAFVSSFD